MDAEPSIARIDSSFNASATLSASRAPASRPWDSSPVAVAPSMPSLANWLEYSVMVSKKSPRLFAPDWNPAVMMSNASVAFAASPLRMRSPAAVDAWVTSTSNAVARSRAVVVTFFSSASDADDIPLICWLTDCRAALTCSVDSPHAPL